METCPKDQICPVTTSPANDQHWLLPGFIAAAIWGFLVAL